MKLYETQDYHTRRDDHSARNKKIDHDGYNLSFLNEEEVYVIKMTNQIVKKLGEDRRFNYGRSYYPVESVISTKNRQKSHYNFDYKRVKHFVFNDKTVGKYV